MRRALGLTFATLVVLTGTSAARGDDKGRCITASEQGQQLRDEGKYTQARDAFASCAREACPAIIRRDCTRWSSELEPMWPTVVLAATDAKGNDLVTVTVEVDGAPFASSLDGKPAQLEPGSHHVHFEADGFTPVDQDIVIRAGEKGRVIEVRMNRPGHAPTPPAPAPSPAARSHAESAASSGGSTSSTVAWSFVGLAIAAFGTEAYFGVTGLSDRSALEESPCAKTSTCAPGDVAAIRTKFAVADVALGVGLVSAALATYFFVSGSDGGHAEKAAAVDVVPGAGGATAVLRGSF